MSRVAAWDSARRAALFEEIPSGIAVIDRSLHIVDHNGAFAEIFGEARGRQCFVATRHRAAPCPTCPVEKTFADGQVRVLEQTGRDRGGRPANYLVQVTPVIEAGGPVSFVAVSTTDITSSKRLQGEYQTLFEKVPCYVSVLNRDLRVVKSNEMSRRAFGDAKGEHCYALFKHRRERCDDCPADETFRDGRIHTASEVGVTSAGEPTHYLVSTAPVPNAGGEATHVIQMALDMTEIHHLEAELSHAHMLREALVEHALDAIVVLDNRGSVKLFNGAAEALLGYPREKVLGRRAPAGLVPKALLPLVRDEHDPGVSQETAVTTASGEDVPVRLAGVRLRHEGRLVGSAFTLQDLREVRQLQREKLDAERLAAVGETVAGLAHGIKNILTGLEGGMYVASVGVQKGEQERVRKGWEMLERNVGRISTLVRSLLAFSRGEQPRVALVSPATVVRDVVGLFRDAAEQHGITITAEVAGDVPPAPLDAEGLHTCLSNLISNAIDACLVSHTPSCSITVRLAEVDDVITFEVIDTGCGMEYEVKQKAFTSFFTTKGAGGTGLGLLLTRKIVQQHGGSVTFDSTSGRGTVFRLRFPRKRLPRLESPEDVSLRESPGPSQDRAASPDSPLSEE